MRHLITIERPKQTRNAYGETITEWVPACEVWARIDDLRGRELLAAGQLPGGEVHTTITLRWGYDWSIDRTMRVRQLHWPKRVWDVQAVRYPDGPPYARMVELDCLERQEVPDG